MILLIVRARHLVEIERLRREREAAEREEERERRRQQLATIGVEHDEAPRARG